MEDLQHRMYNHETPPPDGVWEAISAELDSNEAKVIRLSSKKRKNNMVYYMAAASVGIILFCLILFTNWSSKSNEELVAKSKSIDGDMRNGNTDDAAIITVPTEENPDTKNDTEANNSLAQAKSSKEAQTKDQARQSDYSDAKLIASNSKTKYMTIEGPQGQPVKVSSKMASLINFSETKTPSRPIWHKKINEWREIMKGNTLAPTASNFLDIVELTETLKDNN